MRKLVTIRTQVFVISIILCFLLAGCATLQQKWGQATEDERARLVLFGLQKSLKTTLQVGIDYVAIHPEKKADWQKKIIPMFDATNKILLDLEVKGASGQGLTVIGVSLAVVGRIAEIEAILTGWGVKLTDTSGRVMGFAGLLEGRNES